MRKGKRRSATALSLIALIVTTLLLGSCLSLSQSLELLASDTFSEGFMDRYQEAILRASAKAAAEAAQPLSPREEYYIGRAVAARVFSLYGLYDAPELTDYLNKLGQGLALFFFPPRNLCRLSLRGSRQPGGQRLRLSRRAYSHHPGPAFKS